MKLPDLHTIQIMAVVNITNDSFYAGCRTIDSTLIEQRIVEAVNEGATILDIGGYSSRPGAVDIPLDEEWARVDMGVGIARRVAPDTPISIDTFRSQIVFRAVEKYGEVIVNDITAGEADDQMIECVARLGLPYIIMHMRGTPQTMQSMTEYDDVVEQTVNYLTNRASYIESRGVRRDNIILDPGFGFAKSVEQNYRLLAELSKLCQTGYAVLAGLSRKSMIYKVLNSTPEQSLAGTIALNWEALRQGATILRVHDVKEAVQIATIYDKGFKHL